MLRLSVELRTPLCAGTGAGRPGFVDREAVFGPEGLPGLPARRLKGLLRDAYRELLDTGIHLGLPPAGELFGAIGQEEAGRLRLGDARLRDAAELEPWLNWLSTRYAGAILPEDVIACYSEIRRQTAIDPSSGAARQDTLRATRVLKGGLVFHAPVDILPQHLKEALALAAANVHVMGTSRNRGLGEVDCRIEEETIRGWEDITAEVLERLESSEGRVGENGAAPPRAPTSVMPIKRARAAESVVRFRVELGASALLPSLSGDPFTVFTTEYVPGSVIRGLFANAYLAGGRSVDDRFYELFCGGVCFLSAYPALPERGAGPAMPVPRSIRKYKNDERYVDLAVMDQPEESVTRVSGWTDLKRAQQGLESLKLEVATSLQYHHARAADRRIQRAVGEESAGNYDLEAPDVGALFTYESLRPGQVFTGSIRGAPDDLREIRGLLDEGDTVSIGRSKTAQYGGTATWRWLEPDERGGGAAQAGASSRVILTLLTAVAGLNDKGHPAPEFPFEDLAERLGFAWEEKYLKRAFTREEWQSAYLAHQRLPRQQMPALAAGSVFVLDLPEPRNAEALRHAASFSYGLRAEDGFGRIDLRIPAPEDVESFASFRLCEPSAPSASPVKPSGEPGRSCRALAVSVLQGRVLSAMAADAIQTVEASAGSLKNITPHLLARLMRVIEQNPLAQIAAKISGPVRDGKHTLRETARRQLHKTRVEHGGSRQPLETVLAEACRKPEAIFVRFADLVFDRSAGLRAQFPANPLLGAARQPADAAFADRAVKHYLLRLLRAMALAKRGEARRAAKAAGGSR